MNRRLPLAFALSAITGALLGCSATDRGKAPDLERGVAWVVLPFENHTETPMAGSRAEAIAFSILHARGVGVVHRYSASPAASDALFASTPAITPDSALAWAKEKGARYALAGAVDEWRYKVGVDGEPAVGVALRIVDVSSGETIWSGSGGKSGWSREALSAVAQKLIRSLLSTGLSRAR